MRPKNRALQAADLSLELETVIRLIQERSEMLGTPQSSLALVRVIEGMTPEDWELFASQHGLQPWVYFTLQSPAIESVAKILSAQESLIFQRDHDALTGIGNRGLFNQRFNREFLRAVRTRSLLSLILIDIDDFKHVNDTYGHLQGDEVLQRLAQVLKQSVRPYDTVARIGGEEFGIVLPSVSVWDAERLGNRLLEAFRNIEFTCDGKSFSVTFSAGVSNISCLNIEKTPAALIRSADQALYRAKSMNKNLVVVADQQNISLEPATLVQPDEKRMLLAPDTDE